MLLRALLFVGVFPAVASGQPSTDWLQPLVGVWQTHDTYHPVQGKPIVEQATRTCRMVMRNAYLECETVVARPDGTGRAYRFLLNYNRTVKRFEMISIWSNVPQKAVQSLTPSESRDRWIVENIAVIGDDEEPGRHWSELVIENPNRIVWTGRRVSAAADPRNASVSFLETWTRSPMP